MANTITINRLPTRTWNRLRVNAAEIEWDEANTHSLGDEALSIGGGERPEPLRLDASDDGSAYGAKRYGIDVGADSVSTIFLCCSAANPFSVECKLRIRENASVRLVQLLHPSCGALLCTKVEADCEAGGRLETISLLLGDGDIYADEQVKLRGEDSELKADIAYLGVGSQTIDCNIVADHYGKSTKSEITASGALTDSAKKVFRGTIDFKKGSAGSVGSENETVLMLGENAVNKTVPLILCAEETVEGTHGATIGDLDENTLFYFASRGIDGETAKRIMARAAIERLIRLADDESFAEQANAALSAALHDKRDGE